MPKIMYTTTLLALSTFLTFTTATPLQARQQLGGSDTYTLTCTDNGATYSAIGETAYQFCVAGPEASTPTHCDDSGNIITSVDACRASCQCTPKTPGDPAPQPASSPVSPAPAPASPDTAGAEQPTCGSQTLEGFGVTQDQASIVGGNIGQTVQMWCTGSVVQGVCAKSNPNGPVSFQVKGTDGVDVCMASCSCA